MNGKICGDIICGVSPEGMYSSNMILIRDEAKKHIELHKINL